MEKVRPEEGERLEKEKVWHPHVVVVIDEVLIISRHSDRPNARMNVRQVFIRPPWKTECAGDVAV